MNEYLIRAADPNAYPEDDYRSVVVVGILGDDLVLDILHTQNPTLPGDDLIGGWAHSGEQVELFDEVAFEAIRPLGNNPPRDIFDEVGNVVGQTRGGDATENLLYHHFSGWGQRVLGDSQETDPVMRAYPSGNQPYAIEIRWKEFTDAWPGWGWRAEIIGGADSRDPSVRAIAWYSDPECTQYIGTTGAYVQQDSDWQVDDNGDPIQVWATETPAGFRNPDKSTPWHLANLWASIQEGYGSLTEDIDGYVKLYWKETQPSLESRSGIWVDTGAVVSALAGTLYRISDVYVVEALTPGQSIRFGDTAETVFVGVWSGGNDYIEIDPYVSASVGDVLWALE